MIDELFSRNAFLWVWAWQSTACVALGLGISSVLRRRPGRAHQALLLSMIVAVMVPIMSTLVKHYELGMFVAEPVLTQPQTEDWYTASNHGASGIIPAEDIEHKTGLSEENSPLVMAASESAEFPWSSVVLYGWIAASSFLLGRLIVTFMLGVHLLGHALPLSCKRIEEAALLARAKLEIDKDVRVYSSQAVHSPVIWCWRRRPILLVPSAAGPFNDGVDWASVLCHELAHWKRRDHITGLLAELIVCVLPWNPFLQWSKRRLVRLSEQACDDWVVATGKPCTDYAESLLDLTPASQIAFAPAVVSSKKGLARRVQRILNDRCGNPQTGAAWALAVSIVALCLAVGAAFAQTRPDRTADRAVRESRPGQERVVHFPRNRSVGKLEIQDAQAVRELTYWFHWTGIKGPKWEYLCEAKGDVHVPAGKRLSLSLNKTAWRDLSWLSKLRPDDLYKLMFPYLPPGAVKPGDRCMSHIAHLTGLRFLALDRTDVTDRGLKYLRNLSSLEYLGMPPRVTDRGMVQVATLASLKGLYFPRGGRRITDVGLRYLAKLTSLEEVYLAGERVGNAGLAHLRDLSRLKYLALYGNGFSDDGLVYIKDIDSLRILSFHESLCRITDAGLAHIADIPNLELLCLHGIRDITDDGIAHLSKMQSLKKLEISSSQVTDRGLEYLAQIKTLERLELPQDQKGITDRGLTHLGRLSNLRHLAISRIHFNDPKMNKEYYTDKGLAELANCRLLEELYIGSPGITNEGMRHVAELTHLKKLMLFGCDNVTNEGLAHLTTLHSLKHLYITHTKITIEGLSHLNKIPGLFKLDLFDIEQDHAGLDISGLTKLEELTLRLKRERVGRGNKSVITQEELTPDDLACLGKLKSLRWLQGINGVTDAGLKHLAGLTNMERLSFGAIGLTDEGLKYLANMKNLDLLSFNNKYPAEVSHAAGAGLTDEGLRYLERLKLLSHMQIDSDNNFSTAALQRLRKELPNLNFMNINGRNILTSGPIRRKAPATRQPRRPETVGQRRAR